MAIRSNYPHVPKSVTNPNVGKNDTVDYGVPMSFLTFIKTVDVSFEPEILQKYYNHYLKNWNTFKSGTPDRNNIIIKEQYRNFLKDISLKYTTLEEKKFLSKIDFNNTYDLQIAIPFFSKKLIEIAKYYNEKREDVKFELSRKKLKGSNFGGETTIKENIINLLDNIEDGEIFYNIDRIKSNLEVEIEELYNIYPFYFNQEPSRKFDNKDLDYGLDIFLKDNDEIIADVFSELTQEMLGLKEISSLLDNKRALTEKNIHTDFYYLSTGSTVTDFISGRAFESDNNVLNFLNRDYPTSASTLSGEFKSIREIGFFRPSKTSIVAIDGERSSYEYNFENLEPNSIYYFPDPSLFGKNGDVLTFILNDGFLKKNFSSGVATNQPISNKDDTKYQGYASNIDPTSNKYLDEIFESGYISDSKRDLHQNLFALFKAGNNFKSGVEQYTPTPDPYEEFGTPQNQPITDYVIYEGAFLLNGTTPYTDTISSDLSAYPDSGSFYYDTLIDGGVHSEHPTQRALLDVLTPTLTADASIAITTDEISSFLIDGGAFTDEVIFDTGFEVDSYYYDDSTSSPTTYNLSSYTTENKFNRLDVGGQLLLKIPGKTPQNIVTALPYLSAAYTNIVDNLSTGITKFDMAHNTLMIEMENDFIISKLSFNGGSYQKPTTNSYRLSHNTEYEKISNRFKIGEKVYYIITKTITDSISSNNFIVYPEIYTYNTTTNLNEIVFPISPVTSDFFNLSGGDVRYTHIDTPTLDYNSSNNIFKISFLAKDQNEGFCLHEYDFYIKSDPTFTRHRMFKDNYSKSTTFDILSNLNIPISSNTPIITNQELII